MPQIRVQVQHQLERDVAVLRLQEYSRRMQSEQGDQVSQMKETWSNDGVAEFSFRVLGFAISGSTTVHADIAEVQVQVPFAAIPLRGLIEKEIANRLKSALSDETS